MCVYVNKHGDYGPHLDRKLVQQLPDHFGPAPVNAVLQQAVQACVDCTYQPSVMLSFLQSQSHTGGEVIRGKYSELTVQNLIVLECFISGSKSSYLRTVRSYFNPVVSIVWLTLNSNQRLLHFISTAAVRLTVDPFGKYDLLHKVKRKSTSGRIFNFMIFMLCTVRKTSRGRIPGTVRYNIVLRT